MSLRTILCAQSRLGRIGSMTLCRRSFSTDLQEDGAERVQLYQMINRAARKKPTGYSLNQMLAMGMAVKNSKQPALLATSQFVHTELRVRGSRLVKGLQCLPYGLYNNPEVQSLVTLFEQTMVELMAIEKPTNFADEEAFNHYVKGLLQRHHSTVLHMAHALGQEVMSNEERLMVQPFLDRFFVQRIGNRMMMAQYVALHSPKEEWSGVVRIGCNIRQVVQECVEEVTKLCAHDGVIPEFHITGPTTRINFVPGHLRYIIFELLCNAITATRKAQSDTGENNRLPPVRIIIADGEDDVIIKISDRGGGIKRTLLPQLWTHFFSTSEAKDELAHEMPGEAPWREGGEVTGDGHHANLLDDHGPLVLAGQGVVGASVPRSLPMCRLYARFFGGDVKCFPMEGFGTDFYVYLNKDGDFNQQAGINDESWLFNSWEMPV